MYPSWLRNQLLKSVGAFFHPCIDGHVLELGSGCLGLLGLAWELWPIVDRKRLIISGSGLLSQS